MSHDVLRRKIRRKMRIGLGALALLAAAPALAADLAYPPPYPAEPAPTRIDREERVEEQVPPPPPPQAGPALYGPRFSTGPRFAPPPAEACRTIVKRRVDEFGEEVVRRVRVCDETVDGGPLPPPRPRYRPSFYDPGPPVPPADVPEGRFEGPPRW